MLQYLFRIFIAILAVATLNTPSRVMAEDRLSEGRLSISPFLIDTEVGPGKQSEHTIRIYNTDSVPHRLTYGIQDFIPQGPKGEPRFLTESDVSDPNISLSTWIQVTKQPNFEIPANGSTDVTFVIDAPVAATAGSHYAGILFSFESTSGENITVSRKIGAIILARYGKGKPNAQLRVEATKQNVNKQFTSTATVTNTGNVHISPKGKLNIYNLFGRLVESVPVNENADLVLPNLSKAFTARSQHWHAGPYRAETILYYSTEPKLELRHTQWVGIWPVNDLLALSTGILVGLLLLVFLVKRYNAWIVKKYS